jgi:copper(I)-binding protein
MRPMRRRSSTGALRTILAFAGSLAAFAAFAQVEVADAWVRATVPGQTTTGAFMELVAASDARLVGVSSPVAKVAEIHEMKMDRGVMTMRALARLDLPAGKPVALTPGGYHMMLMGLAKPLKEGETVPITLVVEDKAGRHELHTSARVRGLTAPK